MTKTFKKQRRIPGVLTLDPTDNTFRFAPFQEANSGQTEVKTCAGGGKRWLTTGDEPSTMFTLTCKASSPDPYADVLAQFIALTKDIHPQQPLPKPEEQRLVCEDNVECWANESKGEVTFTGTIDLTRHCRDWQAETLRLMQLVVRRLPASAKFNALLRKNYNTFNNSKQ